VDECDALSLSDKCIALLAGIRADGLQPDRAFPNAQGIQWLLVVKRVCGVSLSKPSIHRCGGSAGLELVNSFRFPLNCCAELHSEHQQSYSKPLPKCHYLAH
jgi:hypothetical protein